MATVAKRTWLDWRDTVARLQQEYGYEATRTQLYQLTRRKKIRSRPSKRKSPSRPREYFWPDVDRRFAPKSKRKAGPYYRSGDTVGRIKKRFDLKVSKQHLHSLADKGHVHVDDRRGNAHEYCWGDVVDYFSCPVLKDGRVTIDGKQFLTTPEAEKHAGLKHPSLSRLHKQERLVREWHRVLEKSGDFYRRRRLHLWRLDELEDVVTVRQAAIDQRREKAARRVRGEAAVPNEQSKLTDDEVEELYGWGEDRRKQYATRGCLLLPGGRKVNTEPERQRRPTASGDKITPRRIWHRDDCECVRKAELEYEEYLETWMPIWEAAGSLGVSGDAVKGRAMLVGSHLLVTQPDKRPGLACNGRWRRQVNHVRRDEVAAALAYRQSPDRPANGKRTKQPQPVIAPAESAPLHWTERLQASKWRDLLALDDKIHGGKPVATDDEVIAAYKSKYWQRNKTKGGREDHAALSNATLQNARYRLYRSRLWTDPAHRK